jgi:translation elongation factor EF-Tu-like GTPase
VNHDDTQTQADPLDHPELAKHVSEELRALLRRVDDGDEDGPIAWLEASEAIVDKERDAVVLAGSEVLEVFDGPITLEDPPEHEGDD